MSAMPIITVSQPRPRATGALPAPALPDPAHLFAAWNEALRRRDAEAVTRLYSADAVLLPTADDDVRVGQAAIRDYFVHFLARGPRGRLLQRHTQLGWDMLVDMGSYAFDFADGSAVGARYTFVWRPLAGGWRITHHHSSVLPERYCGF